MRIHESVFCAATRPRLPERGAFGASSHNFVQGVLAAKSHPEATHHLGDVYPLYEV